MSRGHVRLYLGEGYYDSGKYHSRVNGKKTPEYIIWGSMLTRCYSEKYKLRYKAYDGCTVSDNFKNFQYFAEWCNNQPGFNEVGYQLDKDLLISGNKLYSEDTCVFIPRVLNCFYTTYNGEFGEGVSKRKRSSKFEANITLLGMGKKKYLGSFTNKESAQEAYLVAKIEDSKNWYNLLISKNIPIDPRVISRMKDWSP